MAPNNRIAHVRHGPDARRAHGHPLQCGHAPIESEIEQPMKYSDGQEVRLGDRVKLGQDTDGIVVASIDTGEYSDEHPEAQWRHLKRGVMIKFPMFGLIHYEIPEPDLQLIQRAKKSG